MHSIKLVEKVEEALVQYPEARVKQLERQVELETLRRKEVEKELSNLKKCKHAQNRATDQMMTIHEQVKDVASKIGTQLAPATLKTMRLKQHILDLYKKFGYSDDEA
jgi:vacuolar-type H+-ATPase subunit I/STV1